VKDKVEAAIQMLKSQGHSVAPQVRGNEGKIWFEVDSRMLLSWEEMQHLADGVYSLTELEDLYKRRQKEESNDRTS
jgi:hypothetical protein